MHRKLILLEYFLKGTGGLVLFNWNCNGKERTISSQFYRTVIEMVIWISQCGGNELALERLSMTFTVNGKNETFAVCLQLSAL